MRLKVWAVGLAMVAVVLAGCADDSGTDGSGDEFEESFEELDGGVSSGKGVIRGVVVDETITPIPEANVKVLNTELEATTNEQGAFLFKDVEPGTYFLVATKPGFSEVQTNTEVEADEERPPVVKLVLTPKPGSAPYHTPYYWAGFLGCSMRTPAIGLSCPGAETIWPRHDFLVDYTLDRVPDWVVSEMLWESTQALGGEMSFNIRRTDTNSDTVDVEGPSPLALTLDNATAAEAEFGAGMDMRIIVFTAHVQATEPPGGLLWGVGLQVEQEFEVYTHVFYNYTPPEDWRFLEDQDVPQP